MEKSMVNVSSRIIRFCALSSLLVACSPTGPSPVSELSQSVARWEARQPTTYEFVFRRTGCECIPAVMLPMRITVHEQQIQSVVNLETGEEMLPGEHYAPTIDDLFETLRDALDRDAYRFSAEYDDQFGYPTSVSIEYDREMVDDHILFSARELRAIM